MYRAGHYWHSAAAYCARSLVRRWKIRRTGQHITKKSTASRVEGVFNQNKTRLQTFSSDTQRRECGNGYGVELELSIRERHRKRQGAGSAFQPPGRYPAIATRAIFQQTRFAAFPIRVQYDYSNDIPRFCL